jgi:CheY-like chemotaxis protein
VVEDEFVINQLLLTVLTEEDYHVITAFNGKEALEQLAKHSVDLVMADLMMPVLDGYGLCQAMQANPSYHAIPLVLMSAGQKPFSQEDCSYLTFIQKPFTLDTLLDLIATLLTTEE